MERRRVRMRRRRRAKMERVLMRSFGRRTSVYPAGNPIVGESFERERLLYLREMMFVEERKGEMGI